MSLLHEEHRDGEGRLLLFECTECGQTYLSLGALHAHVEGHWSFLGGLIWHMTHYLREDGARKWWEYTRIRAVEETETVGRDALP